MNVLDLFSGIGGFSLGLERAGMRTVAFCEIEPYARRVLAKHWPGVPCYDDVRTLTGDQLAADGISVDVICGGFPCQDISPAGRGEGIDGARSNLWREYARIIGEVRPDWVIIENSHFLRKRGADRVLGDLEARGYSWGSAVVGAAHAGAPHRRQRVYILAHAHREQHQGRCAADERAPSEVVSSNADRSGLEIVFAREPGQRSASVRGSQLHRNSYGLRELQSEGCLPKFRGRSGNSGWWAAEPDVGRMAHGVPSRVDRLRCLGNAVVPVIPEMIGRAIMQQFASTRAAA